MVQAVAVVGAGGFGREVLEYARDAQDAGWGGEIVGFFDDGGPVRIDLLGGRPLLGNVDALAGTNIQRVIVAVGDPVARRQLAQRIAGLHKTLETLVHPTSYVARTATVGLGSVVCPHAFIGTNALVGGNVAINAYASIGHDARVGADCVLSPYAAVTGAAELGDACFIGPHATIAPNVTVGAFSKVNAGAFVTKEAPPGSLLVGVPAKGRVMFGARDETH